MFSWLKKHFTKHFIPHTGNDHRPHILRSAGIRNIVAVVIFLEIFTFVLPTLTHLNLTGGMAAVLPAVLADLTNEEREEENLAILTVNPVLNQAAEMKAKDMAENGYFAHTSPEGKTPWYWLEQVGYGYQYAGENLAINFSDSKDVTKAWMESPTHRANIVKGNYTEMGTGVARGEYQGEKTVFVAQIYANPLPIVVETQPTKAESSVTEPPISTKPPAPPLPPQKVPQKTVEPVKVAVVSEPKNVLGVETVAASAAEPAFWQKLIASPRSTMNAVLFVVFGIVALALLLYIFIKIKNHHRGLITNGMVALAILGAIFVINYRVTHRDMVVTQSLDYRSQL